MESYHLRRLLWSGLLLGEIWFSSAFAYVGYTPHHVRPLRFEVGYACKSCRTHLSSVGRQQQQHIYGLIPFDRKWSKSPGLRKSLHCAAKTTETTKPRDSANLVPLFILLGIINRIIYRIQLVPMKDFTYFISQFISLCYVLCYGTIFFFRRRANIVTDQMLAYARSQWHIFACIGLLESLCFLIALYSAARIPGGMLSVLGQAGLIWTVLFARTILNKRFDAQQLCGLVLVLAGTLTCTVPQAIAAAATTTTAGAALNPAASRQLITCMLTYFLSTIFSSLAFTLKERAFRGADLDIFIVSTTGSIAQCLFTLLLLPLTFALATDLSPAEYLRRGAAAFAGGTHPAMPWLALAYVAANLGVNIAGITLLKRGGAVATSIAGAAMVPLTGLAFCLDLPLLGRSPFRWSFLAGLAVVAAGSLLYNHRAFAPPPPPPAAASPPPLPPLGDDAGGGTETGMAG